MEASSEFRRCQDQAAAGREQAKDLDHDSGLECVNPSLNLAAQFSAGLMRLLFLACFLRLLRD